MAQQAVELYVFLRIFADMDNMIFRLNIFMIYNGEYPKNQFSKISGEQNLELFEHKSIRIPFSSKPNISLLNRIYLRGLAYIVRNLLFCINFVEKL